MIEEYCPQCMLSSNAGDDKFVLALASNDGQPASDELTMKWDYKKDDFEIVRPPAQL